MKFLWVDMEMTGLDVSKERIIEVAALVTDEKFNVIDTYETVVFQPQEILDKMDDWNKTHHGQSGLLAKIPHGKPEAEVDRELAAFTQKHFTEKAILSGNTIGQDRLFIDKHLKEFSSLLHYRMLDVTAWKIVFEGLYHQKFKKQDKHRAIDDIQESIAELKHYLSFIKMP